MPVGTALPKDGSAFLCTNLVPRTKLPPEAALSNVN